MTQQPVLARDRGTRVFVRSTKQRLPARSPLRVLALLDGTLKGSELASACEALERALAPDGASPARGRRMRRWRVREPGESAQLAAAAEQALAHPLALDPPALDWFDGLAGERSALCFALPERRHDAGTLPLSARLAARLPLPAAYFGRAARALFDPRRAAVAVRAPAASVHAVALSSLEPAALAAAMIKHACSRHEVAACAIAGGLHRYLRSRGVALRSLELPGLRLAGSACARSLELPVDVENDALRLTVVQRALREPDRASSGGALAFLLRGPDARLELCGRRIEALWPLARVHPSLGLAVGAICYGGGLYLGLQGDAARWPDVDKLARGIEESLEVLCTAES